MNTLMNIDEVAEYLHLKKSTVYSYTSKEQIPFIKLGGKLLFDSNDISKWLEKSKTCPKQLTTNE